MRDAKETLTYVVVRRFVIARAFEWVWDDWLAWEAEGAGNAV